MRMTVFGGDGLAASKDLACEDLACEDLAYEDLACEHYRRVEVADFPSDRRYVFSG